MIRGKKFPKRNRNQFLRIIYVQVNDQTTSVHGSQAGTGLGLGITQSLVRLMGGEIGIVDKKIGEKGTCFRFNIFLKAWDQPQAQENQAVSVNYAREEDLESQLGGISSDSYYGITSHQKPENSNVVLFIKEEERSRVLCRFIKKIIGLKVYVVNRHEDFSQTLKKVIRNTTNFASYNSSSSSGKSKEIPLSASDGTGINDHINISSFQRRGGGLIRFILIIIDTSVGLTREIGRAMAEYRKDFPKNVSLRVVWLDKPGVEEDRLPSTDIVMAKPLHGSCLYRVLKFAPESEGTNLPTVTQEIKDETTSRMKIQQPPMRSGSPPLEAKRQDISVDVNGSPSENLPLTGKKILVVEDNRVLLMICKTKVSSSTTDTCENGEKALALVHKVLSDQCDIGPSTPSPPFDYILMDPPKMPFHPRQILKNA
ncbi:histidine kinase CKI1-like [Lycium ferocissimum]|uniref:histidine kinase CKI1-like n=1 Tax=Lycium ferocissimum TaxID=112874 RepID=UPI002815AE1A|nr:histidine kinase CKI1-like [Lycium ferocissimum]XP_059287062.1 histidine kinase CKI1-like [Lycium ferocissimum]XP_059287063.1 histidine kinase CKI1-like [Lycium ferocissimum]XP_059287064.1 histidine kinase CKI1-like [Lycium ferocissimum]XP_059287065.1 histidine kinase CKI1-like [Lycium ferocissimum]